MNEEPKTLYRSEIPSASNTLRREVERIAKRGLRPEEVALLKSRKKQN